MSPKTDRPEPATVTDARSSTSVLLNGLRVLETFTLSEPVLGVSEIARRVDLHKSTVSRILSTLEQAGYVKREDGNGGFRLGLGLIALAGPLLADLDVRRAAYPALERLTRQTEETSALLVWNGHESVVVEQVQSPKPVRHTSSIGTRYNTYESSSVQVFLAEQQPRDIDRLIDTGLLVGGRDTNASPTDLDTVRERGYAINDGSTSAEEMGISAPVRDHRGMVVAAILMSAPRFRVPPSMHEPLGRNVMEAAREVSRRLGHTPGF